MRAPSSGWHIGVQTKILVLGVLCVMGPLLGSGIYLLNRNREVLSQKVRETLSNRLFRQATQIDDWMGERVHEAARWSASFVVWEGVDQLASSPGESARIHRDLKDFLLSVQGHYHAYEALFIVDTRGEVIESTRSEQLEEWAKRLLDQNRDKTGVEAACIVSPLLVSERLGRPTRVILQPIQDKNGRLIGYFVERLDLREITTLLSPPFGDRSVAFWLLDGEGRVLAKGGWVQPSPGTEAFPGFSKTRGREDEPRIGETTFPGQGLAVFGLRRLEGPGGGFLAATVPTSVAYQPLVESTNRLLVWGLSAIAVVFLLNVFLARRMLRPILLLSESAKRMSAGDLDVYLPVLGHDEIADLTVAFNQMARGIREGRQNLEDARDELARSNEGLKSANRTLEALAITDGLTGLYNRRHFQEMLEKEIRRCEREGRSLGLLLLDLDHFKQYNDQWGHSEGDAALRRAAGCIAKSIRGTDMAFRYGGEEFAVLLPACPKAQAVEVADKIRVTLSANPQRPRRLAEKTTVSIGVAVFPEDGGVARALVDRADVALYAAKAQGRNRVIPAGREFPDKTETAG